MSGAAVFASTAEALAVAAIALAFIFEKRLARAERRLKIRLKKYLRRKLFSAR